MSRTIVNTDQGGGVGKKTEASESERVPSDPAGATLSEKSHAYAEIFTWMTSTLLPSVPSRWEVWSVPDSLTEVLKRRFEVSLSVFDLPREHGLSDLEKAGPLIRHDQICVDACVFSVAGNKGGSRKQACRREWQSGES